MRTGARLTDKVCVVVGSGGGIGGAVADAFSREGGVTALVDIDAGALEDRRAQIERDGGRAHPFVADVTSADAVDDLFQEIEDRVGLVDVLVNSVWVPRSVAPEDLSYEDWQFNLDVNLTSYFLCCQAAGRQMIARHRGGSIINISSIAGSSGMGRNAFAYSICKGAINAMTRELAVEWGAYGIRTNAILPCQVNTPGLEVRREDPEFSQALETRILPGIPAGRLAEPGDMAGAAVFLASEEAAMVNGVLLPVDGGNLAMNAGGSPRQVAATRIEASA